jgi:hypothetical protein
MANICIAFIGLADDATKMTDSTPTLHEPIIMSDTENPLLRVLT